MHWPRKHSWVSSGFQLYCTWPFPQNCRQSLGTKLHTPSSTNPFNTQTHRPTQQHTHWEHEHVTHPQDARKWGLLPSLTMSRLGLKLGLFTASSWPVSSSKPYFLRIYSPIISLPEHSRSSQDDKHQSIQWILLWLCGSNLFSHPVCSEGICDHALLFVLDLCLLKPSFRLLQRNAVLWYRTIPGNSML